MKKCPKCHKNIPSNAKVCPYCGTPQSGYQPMKRTPKRKYAFIYPILIIAFVFLPMGISYFFAFNTLSDSGINQTATLKTYTKSNQETVVYQYDSLKEFSKNVKNSKKYVNKINNMESSLEKIVGTLVLYILSRVMQIFIMSIGIRIFFSGLMGILQAHMVL